MTMSQRSCALVLCVVAAVCIPLCQAQGFTGRCSCEGTVKFVKGNMSDFQVLEPRPGCDKTEFIMTITKPDSSTEKFCMNMQGRMAMAFLRCWERINKEESRKMECIDRKKKAE